VRPPAELCDPCVEDWVDPAEAPPAGDSSPLNRLPSESDLAWSSRQLADRRFRAAWETFKVEHAGRKLDVTREERRRELLGEATRWRDMRAFLTRENRP
jgi:hypothetical protein